MRYQALVTQMKSTWVKLKFRLVLKNTSTWPVGPPTSEKALRIR